MILKKNNVLQVIEHQRIKVGYNDLFKQYHFNALLNFNLQHENKYFEINHNSVKFTEYVGVIQVCDLTIEILPKADKGSIDEDTKNKWRDILLKMLKECGYIKTESLSSANLKLRSNSILDLYFEIFVTELEYILRMGLVKQYRKNHGNLKSLKGSLNFQKQINENFIHKERFYTKHTIYDNIHILHKILYKTLNILNIINSSVKLKDRITRLIFDFPEMQDISVTSALFDNLNFNRKTEGYKNAIYIAKLILLNYRPDIISGKNNVLAILFDMNKLWEKYVLVKLKKYAKNHRNIKVNSQKSRQFWKNRFLKPDIIIEATENNQIKTFVIDTKWKNLKTVNPSIEDLRQVFAYNEYWKAIEGMLLYPQINDLSDVKGNYKSKIHSCKIGFVPIETTDNFAETIINKFEMLNKISVPVHNVT